MNRTAVKEVITDHIQYFKNSSWKIDTFRNKELPSSTVAITDDASFLEMKEAQLTNISQYLSEIPPYRLPKSKEKSVNQCSMSTRARLYPNRHFERLKIDQAPSVFDIPIIAADSDEQLVDVRVKGGGLRVKYVNELIGHSPHIYSYADIGRYSVPSAAAASILLQLPKDIANKYEEVTIQNIVKKYTAAGIHVSIAYYESQPVENLGWKLQGSETA